VGSIHSRLVSRQECFRRYNSISNSHHLLIRTLWQGGANPVPVPSGWDHTGAALHPIQVAERIGCSNCSEKGLLCPGFDPVRYPNQRRCQACIDLGKREPCNLPDLVRPFTLSEPYRCDPCKGNAWLCQIPFEEYQGRCNACREQPSVPKKPDGRGRRAVGNRCTRTRNVPSLDIGFSAPPSQPTVMSTDNAGPYYSSRPATAANTTMTTVPPPYRLPYEQHQPQGPQAHSSAHPPLSPQSYPYYPSPSSQYPSYMLPPPPFAHPHSMHPASGGQSVDHQTSYNPSTFSFRNTSPGTTDDSNYANLPQNSNFRP
jgi:hypothetical protein